MQACSLKFFELDLMVLIFIIYSQEIRKIIVYVKKKGLNFMTNTLRAIGIIIIVFFATVIFAVIPSIPKFLFLTLPILFC
jgi:hypothetical protein